MPEEEGQVRCENYEHGFPPADWEAAKEEARQAMIAAASRRKVITYAELVTGIHTLRLEPRSKHLAHMLGEVSTAERAAGRGMLTVVVVRKSDQIPGAGFFELARTLGCDDKDRLGFCATELAKVHETWAGRTADPAEPAVRRAAGSLRSFRFPESESALLAGITAENARADLLAEPSDRELGL